VNAQPNKSHFDNDSGCALSNAPRGAAGFGGALAALSSLARRTRRLLKR